MLWQALPEPELDAESRAAFDTAYSNIRAFHEAQRAADVEVETMPGVRCRRITRPIGAHALGCAQRALGASGAPAQARCGRTGCYRSSEVFLLGVSCTCDILRMEVFTHACIQSALASHVYIHMWRA